jgi:transcriptional regulator with GAF, ATPase, and Fis domain
VEAAAPTRICEAKFGAMYLSAGNDTSASWRRIMHRQRLPRCGAGARSHIVVPMLKDNELIGAISIYRQEVRPFADRQVALLTSFASRAVIAIENTRLLSELRESLQQQTATSEVLQVISVSPGDLTPVFSSILANARRICEANFAHLLLYDGKVFPRRVRCGILGA